MKRGQLGFVEKINRIDGMIIWLYVHFRTVGVKGDKTEIETGKRSWS
ncbi:hypothetical protein [Brevibacillus sp. SIMBA_076]